MQRKCGSELGAPSPDCTPTDMGVIGWQFLFKVNCDELMPGEEANTAKFKAGSKLRVHGFASLEGKEDFNLDLSCHRANKVADLIRTARSDVTVEATFKHGASPKSAPGVVPDVNPASFWRSVTVEEIKGTPEPPPPKSVCGPDATDWLIQQVVTAKKNAKVRDVRKNLDIAAFFAPNLKPKGQMFSTEILEGAVLEKIGTAWTAAGKPHATADANMQMQQAQFGLAELQTAKAAALALDADAVTVLKALRDASLQWKDLVGTGEPFDFKNDASTMKNPTSAHCPDTDCSNTITVCPGSKGLNCFGKDFPGNVVYATVGAFAGFSENALQLGSQWAQLASTKTWDPPEDTAMISFAFNLPSPITRSGFCSALQSAKSGLSQQTCADCNETTSAKIIDP